MVFQGLKVHQHDKMRNHYALFSSRKRVRVSHASVAISLFQRHSPRRSFYLLLATTKKKKSLRTEQSGVKQSRRFKGDCFGSLAVTEKVEFRGGLVHLLDIKKPLRFAGACTNLIFCNLCSFQKV